MSLTRTNTSKYPSQIDTDNELRHVIDNVSEVIASDFNNLKDSIIAIENTIGTGSSLSSLSLSSTLSTITDDLLADGGDVMWGDLTFQYQDLNASNFPARLFFGACNCAIGFDGRQFFPGNVEVSDGEYSSYEPDVGSLFVPTAEEKGRGVVSGGVVPLTFVGPISNNRDDDYTWLDREVSSAESDHVDLRKRVKVLDDLEVTGRLNAMNFLAIRGLKTFTTQNRFGTDFPDDTTWKDRYDNYKVLLHDTYGSDLVIVGTSGPTVPEPTNELSSNRTNMLVTKNAYAGKLFGGEYGTKFLGAKFWKTWQDANFDLDNIAPFHLTNDNIETLEDEDFWKGIYSSTSGDILSHIQANINSPGGMSREFNRILASPLKVEIDYDTCLYRDRGIDDSSRSISSNVPNTYGNQRALDIGPRVPNSKDLSGTMASSKNKLLWVTISCEVEDPASLTLLIGNKFLLPRESFTGDDSFHSNDGIVYREINSCTMERRSHGKENICSFSFLINPAAFHNEAIERITDNLKTQLRHGYGLNYAVTHSYSSRPQDTTSTSFGDILMYNYSNYAKYEPKVSRNMSIDNAIFGISPMTWKQSHDTGDYVTSLAMQLINYPYLFSGESFPNNTFYFTLRRNRISKKHPSEFLSADNPYLSVDGDVHLPIATEIMNPTDENTDGWDPDDGNADDAQKRLIIENLFESAPEVKNILMTVFVVDDAPHGYESMDQDVGLVQSDFGRSINDSSRGSEATTPRGSHYVEWTDIAGRWNGTGGKSDNIHDPYRARLDPRQFIGYSYFADSVLDESSIGFRQTDFDNFARFNTLTSSAQVSSAMRLDYRRIWRH